MSILFKSARVVTKPGGRRLRFSGLALVLLVVVALVLAVVGVGSAEKIPVSSFCTAGTTGGLCIANGAESPRGVAADQSTGDVYVADTNDNRIEEFSSAGAFIRAWGWGVVASGAPNRSSAIETVTVKASSGTFTLTYAGQTTSPALDYNASAAEVQSALDALSTIGGASASVTVTGGPGEVNGERPYIIAFGGSLGDGATVSALTATVTGGGTATVNSTYNPSGTGFDVCDTTTTPADTAAQCGAGTSGSGPGELDSPSGVAVDQSTGDVYVSEPAGFRVDEFSEDGVFIRRWGAGVVEKGPDLANETQAVTINATGGDFTLTFGASTTAEIPATATAAQVQTALDALSTISTGGGSVTVSGGPGNAGGSTPYVVTFGGGPLAGTSVATMTAASGSGSPLSGGSASVSVAVTNAGATGFEVCNPMVDICKVGVTGVSGGAFASAGAGQIAVNPTTQNVIVADAGNIRLQEFSSSGAFIRAFGGNVVSAGPDKSTTPANAVQKLTLQASSGTFTLTFSAKETAALPYNATASEVQTALEGLSNIGAGVIVSGGPGNATGADPYVVTFAGALAGTNVAQVTVNTAGLGVAAGAVLSCVPGVVWPASGEAENGVSYQWLADASPIPGATSATYTIPSADAGEAIQCQVIARNTVADTTTGLHTAVAQASAPAVVGSAFPAPAPPTPPTSITFTSNGTGGVIGKGDTLTCSAGTWGGSPTLSYQWYRDDVAISGATSSTYELSSAANEEEIKGYAFQCAVTGANSGGAETLFSASKNSAVKAPSPVAPSSVTATVPALTTVVTTTAGGAGFEVCKAEVDACQKGEAGTAPGLFAAESPTRVAVDGAGDIYALDRPNNRVEKLTPSGGSFTATEFGPSGLAVAPFALAVDPANSNVLIARRVSGGTSEAQIAEYSPAGVLLATYAAGSKIAESQTISVTGGGMDTDAANGSIYLSLPSATNPRVLRIATPPSPVPTISAVTGVGSSSATFHGTVNPEGLPTGYHFEYSTNDVTWSKSPTTNVSVGEGTAPVSVEQSVTGLQPGSVYHVRLVAANTTFPAEINVTSSEVLFETGQAPPLVFSTLASPVTTSTAKLTGYVNPDGSPTSYRFEWGTTTSYGNDVPAEFSPFVGSGSQPLLVSVTISRLQPGSTYHFRLTATSSVGTTYGLDQEFTTPATSCPNELLRAENDSTALPECRAYEMVAPVFKNGNTLNRTIYSGLSNSFLSTSYGNFGEAHPANRSGPNFETRRTESGWVTTSIDPPAGLFPFIKGGEQVGHASADNDSTLRVLEPGGGSKSERVFYLREMDGSFAPVGPTYGAEKADFTSADLSHILFTTIPVPNATNVPHEYVGTNNIAPLPVLVDNNGNSVTQCGGANKAISAAGSTVIAVANAEGCTGGGAGPPVSQLLARIDNGQGNAVTVNLAGTVAGSDDVQRLTVTATGGTFVLTYGGALGKKTSSLPYNATAAEVQSALEALSTIGAGNVAVTAAAGTYTITFVGSLSGESLLAMTVNTTSLTGGTATITATAGSPGCSVLVACNVTVAPVFAGHEPKEHRLSVGMSEDGSKVFFTSTQALPVTTGTPVLDSTNNIYECELPGDSGTPPAASGVVDPCPSLRSITATGTTSGANVEEVIEVSSDGSHVYYTSRNVLTSEANALGQTAVPGSINLYVYQRDAQYPAGHTSFAATLPESPSSVSLTPDGRYMVFLSNGDLTPDDTSTVNQVFRYDAATGDLLRVSIGEDGFHEDGNTSIANDAPLLMSTQDANEGETFHRESPISDDGSRIVFITEEALVPSDTNNAPDDYIWNEGQVSLISGGTSATAIKNPDGSEPSISPSGSDVFFATKESLNPLDRNGNYDTYDARIEGGFPATAETPSCVGEECLGAAPQAPVFGQPGSTTFTGGTNLASPPLVQPLTVKPVSKPKALTRAQKLADALKACRKQAKKQRAKCEKQARKRYGPEAKSKKPAVKHKTTKSSGKGSK